MLKAMIRCLILVWLWQPWSLGLAEEHPNVVLFIADDVSAEDLGCYGHPHIQTPAIDKLAKSGLRFDNAYLVTSSCSPSRCSIITGRYPHNTGAPELHTKLPESQIRFPELLRKSGYYTVLSGKNHMFGNKDRAFDTISGGDGPGKEEDWVKQIENCPVDKPFFCWLASTDAHREWHISPPDPTYTSDQVVVPPYLVDSEKTRQDLANYYHEISRWDRHIGLVVEAIQKRGQLDNTMIIVMADNGRPFPRCKTRLYESGIKTPLVVHFPKLIKTRDVSKSLVSTIDISATILELAGLEKNNENQGQSFVPILKNPEAPTREVAFSEHNWHVYQAHERMVRFGDFLYIKNNYPELPNLCVEAISFPAGEDLAEKHGAGQTTAAQQNIFRQPCPPEELFQVSEDAHQLHDLSQEAAFAETLNKARKLLAEWTEQTGDSIPQNPTLTRESNIRGAKRNNHAEFPGVSRNAAAINHPGPFHLE
jgi:N-sulfoglucosamine sulfohydrolase